MDNEIREHCQVAPEKQPQRQLGHRTTSHQIEECPRATATNPIKCFQCGQQECLALTPVPQVRAPTPAKPKRAPRRPAEKGKFVCLAVEVPLSDTTGEEGTLDLDAPIILSADGEEDDPM
ncbi:hypothetical protein E2320_003730, partial [Naja naja]